jgi:hypothetical protein
MTTFEPFISNVRGSVFDHADLLPKVVWQGSHVVLVRWSGGNLDPVSIVPLDLHGFRLAAPALREAAGWGDVDHVVSGEGVTRALVDRAALADQKYESVTLVWRDYNHAYAYYYDREKWLKERISRLETDLREMRQELSGLREPTFQLPEPGRV